MKSRLHYSVLIWACTLCFLLLSALPIGAQAQLPNVPIPPKFKNQAEFESWKDALDTWEKTKSQKDIGQDINDKYGLHGSNWEGDRYKEHPWYNGNPQWMQAWVGEDTNAIMKDFFNCFELTILGPCGPCCILVEYWWPEVVGEANNFCIGAFWAGQLRKPFTALKETMMPPVLTRLKTKDGQKAEFPNGLREDPNLGESHTDSEGAYPGRGSRMYESHLYRSFFDTAIALADIPCWSGCLRPPPPDVFPLQWSEVYSPLWRIPELSMLRPLDNDKYAEMYGTLWFLALKPGIAYHGGTLSPNEGVLSAIPAMHLNTLRFGTCASYRAWKEKLKYPISSETNYQIMPNLNPEMEKLCYHQSLGQLYPLTGDIEVSSETTSPIGAIRRIFEWGSMDIWTDMLRSNYYNDYKGKNLYRWIPTGKTKIGNRKADKIQRAFPEPTKCYRTDDIDERDHDRWPKGLIKEKDFGDRREIHWNRRRCCICFLGCSSSCVEIPLEE